jgi:hypothetical protein
VDARFRGARAAAHCARDDFARSRRRRRARLDERNDRELPLRAVRARGGATRLPQQLRPVRDGGRGHCADHGARSRISWYGAAHASCAR